MSRPLFTNNASTVLARAITPTDTILQLTAGTGQYFPQPTLGNYFMLTLVQVNNPEVSEIVECIDRVGDVLTVIRGQEGTAPQIFNLSDSVELRITASSLNLFSGDSSASNIEFTPYGFVTATNVQSAVDQTIDKITSNSNALASSTGSSLIGYNEGGGSAVTRTVQVKLQETISVKDFGATGNGSTDDTTAIQNAINAVIAQGGGTLFFPAGTYSITSTLTVPGAVILKGAGPGSNSLPTFPAVTKILWNGGSSPMVIIGGNGNGTTVVGGGMSNMQLEGNSYTASRCLVIKDLQRGVFENLYLSYCSDAALYLTNTAGLITGFCDFSNIAIQLIGGVHSTANGIYINGVSSGVDGTTLCNFYNCTISHDNGAGVLIGEVGDACNWIKLFTSRPFASTGIGVWFSGTDTAKPSGYHHFVQPIVTAGFFFSGAGKNVGTKIDNANWGYDNAPNALLMFGAGADEVLCTDMLGFAYGRGLIGENHVSKINDPMQLIYVDSTNKAVITSAGAWKYETTGTAPVDANQPGGAIALTTSTVLNNISAIYAPSNNASGVYLIYNVAIDTVVAVNQTANTEYIFGFADSTTADPIQNGVYIKYNYTNSPYFQCVCVKAGTATTVTTSIGPSSIDNFYIWSDGTNVNFYYRAVNTYILTLLASINTNVPVVPLLSLYRAKNKSSSGSSVASLFVYSHKLGFIDEDGF